MNKFSKYVGCKYLICHTTFTTNVYGGTPITFEKGVKHLCVIGESENIIFVSLDIIFDNTDDNDVKLIYENFHTPVEHRKFKIENL